jgi:hypothetical protein
MLSLYCVTSILPCGRYYYEPEGGYVGNTWVKFSLQFVYIYLGWLVHHLDLLDHYIFQCSQLFIRRFVRLKSFFFQKFTFLELQKNPYITKLILNK